MVFLILNCAICHTNLCLCVNALQTEVRRVYVFMSHFYVLIARKLIFLVQILKIQVQKKYYWRFSVARTWRPLIGDKVVRRPKKKSSKLFINRMCVIHVWHAKQISMGLLIVLRTLRWGRLKITGFWKSRNYYSIQRHELLPGIETLYFTLGRFWTYDLKTYYLLV